MACHDMAWAWPVITVFLRVRFMLYFLLFQLGRQQKCLKAEEVLTSPPPLRRRQRSVRPSHYTLCLWSDLAGPLPSLADGISPKKAERRRELAERRHFFLHHLRERERERDRERKREKGKKVGGNFSSLVCDFCSTDNCKYIFACREAAKLSIPHRIIGTHTLSSEALSSVDPGRDSGFLF